MEKSNHPERSLYLAIFFLTIFFTGISQDLDSLLKAEMGAEGTRKATVFRSTSLANGHSVTLLPPKTLDFRIEHRFGAVNSGFYELFGLDNADIHFSFEYGITRWLMAGVGRGTYEKTYDGFIRISPLNQQTGDKPFPFSLSYQGAIYINTLRYLSELPDYKFSQRLEQVHQLMIGRIFKDLVSVQLTPSYLKRVPVMGFVEQLDLFALGTGLGVIITNGFSVNAEYFYIVNRDNDLNTIPIYNPLSISLDLETGGHIFQLIFSNSRSTTEHGNLGNTNGKWLEGDIYFGFNISRVFNFSTNQQ